MSKSEFEGKGCLVLMCVRQDTEERREARR